MMRIVWEESWNSFIVYVFGEYLLMSLLCLYCCLFDMNGLFFLSVVPLSAMAVRFCVPEEAALQLCV